jgi:hypothetical protein
MELGLKNDPSRRLLIKNDLPKTINENIWNIIYQFIIKWYDTVLVYGLCCKDSNW